MRRFYKGLLIIAVFGLAGCHKKKDGPPDNSNVIVNLSCKDRDGNSIFGEEIRQVTAVVFREDGEYYGTYAFDGYDLAGFEGAKLELPEGEVYHIGFWANLTPGSKISDPQGEPRMEEWRIRHAGVNPLKSCDPFFYGYTRIPPGEEPVPERSSRAGITEVTVDLVRAHRVVEVYVQNLTDDPGAAAPSVEIEDVPDGYDFFFQPAGETVVYEQRTVPVKTLDGDAFGARFTIPRLNAEYPTLLHVKRGSDGQRVYMVDLHEFMPRAEPEQQDAAEDEYTVVILITFTESGVSVTLPDWAKRPVLPGF